MGIRDAWRGLQVIGRTAAPATHERKESALRAFMARGLPTAKWRLHQKTESFYREGYQQNVIVYRCISLIAEAAASAPPIAYAGDRQLTSHPALDLLINPNPRQSGEDFRQAVFAYDLLAGESFQELVGPRGMNRPPREVYAHRPDLMHAIIDKTTGEVSQWQAKYQSRTLTLPPEQVLHVKRFNPVDPYRGQSPLMPAARSADSHNEATTWNYRVLQNGAKPSGVLQQEANEQPLTDDEYLRLKTELDEQFSGSQNAGRPLLLEGGLKWVQMMLTQSDIDWLKGKELSAREVALAFDVPEQLVGVPGQQTYNNYREARLALYEDAVLPLLDRYFGAWTQWARRAYNEPSLRLTYDVDQMPALSLRRERTWEKVQQADFLTVNEQREAVGYEPVEGGDVIFVGAGQLPLTFAATEPDMGGRDVGTEDDDPQQAAALAYGTETK